MQGYELVGYDGDIDLVGQDDLADFLVGDYNIVGDDASDAMEEHLEMMGYDDDEIDDIMGAYDIVGGEFVDDVDDLIGRRGRRGRRSRGRRDRRTRRSRGRRASRRARPASTVAKRVAESKAIVTPKVPTKSRQWPIGFNFAGVAAGATVDITSRPQVIFQPQRITVPSSIASFFLINDIRIGQKSQLINSEALPAATFVEDAVSTLLRMDTAQISQDIVMRVTNIDVAAQNFSASMIGEIVE